VKRTSGKKILLGLFAAPVLACAQAPVADLFSLACADDIRVEGCLGGSLAWTYVGNDLVDGGTSTWHSSQHMRMRRMDHVDSLVWEYMRYCEPWPVRANVLDTLRIIRLADGHFVESHAVPYRTDNWKVAGVRTTVRPLLVEDTVVVKARSLPRKARTGCMAVYRSHTFRILLLRTADEGPPHHYAWTPETGLLYMIVPDRGDSGEVQQLIKPEPSNFRFMQVEMAGEGREALIAAMVERSRR
jgi:hypothetical protein